MEHLPEPYRAFKETHPEVWAAYDRLGAACQDTATLDERTRRLIKLGIAIGFRAEGAVHSQARKALAAGATPDEIRQVALLAITTIGFPASMAALTWLEDVLDIAVVDSP